MKLELIVGAALAASNFAWQLGGAQDWAVATERSWFQFTACLAVGLADLFVRRAVGAP
jgi:hypothetical protein